MQQELQTDTISGWPYFCDMMMLWQIYESHQYYTQPRYIMAQYFRGLV